MSTSFSVASDTFVMTLPVAVRWRGVSGGGERRIMRRTWVDYVDCCFVDAVDEFSVNEEASLERRL
jgi:hypothetical protein